MGNIPFELSIRPSTEITEKGWYGADECENPETTEVEDWKNIAEMESQKITEFFHVKTCSKMQKKKNKSVVERALCD